MKRLLLILLLLPFWGYSQIITEGKISYFLYNGDTVDYIVQGKDTLYRLVPFAVVPPAPDTTPPVLTLIGPSSLTITTDDTYNEPGWTVTDDRDGDLSGSVVVTGSVDDNTVGSYTLQYNVSDAAGNAATARARVIDVIAPVNYDAMIVAGDALSPDPKVLGFKSVLEGMGKTVLIRDDDALVASDTVGMDVIMISSTVTSAKVRNKGLEDSVTPIWLENEFLYDEFGLGKTRTKFYDSDFAVAATHPIFDEALGTYSVGTTYSLYGTGNSLASPGTASEIPAGGTILDDGDGNGFFGFVAYDVGGARATTGNFPGRRIAFPMGTGEDYSELTTVGQSIFQASLNWLMNTTTAAPSFNEPGTTRIANTQDAAHYDNVLIGDLIIGTTSSGNDTDIVLTNHFTSADGGKRIHILPNISDDNLLQIRGNDLDFTSNRITIQQLRRNGRH